ncbi:MAG: hypothetical protein OXI67_11420 [Candidatus Poribacteria bacterium]|nr:hypothetical protein [Candidatus Poribacteria bacterium]MDE0483181.1 hypothetical protein [Candidatus Poribacteria bacterium]
MMYIKRFACLILPCFILASFYFPEVLAQDIIVEDIEVIDLKSRSVVGKYVVGEEGLELGSVYLIDRDYFVKDMSEEFEGATFIMTAMEDERSKGADFITFRVKVPIVVWLATDKRWGNPPKWASDGNGWKEQPDYLVQTNEEDTDIFVLLNKEFSAGDISLGGNNDAPANLAPMYWVFLTRGVEGAAVEATDKLTTTWGKLKSNR